MHSLNTKQNQSLQLLEICTMKAKSLRYISYIDLSLSLSHTRAHTQSKLIYMCFDVFFLFSQLYFLEFLDLKIVAYIYFFDR